jgi:hypothetical protein
LEWGRRTFTGVKEAEVGVQMSAKKNTIISKKQFENLKNYYLYLVKNRPES